MNSSHVISERIDAFIEGRIGFAQFCRAVEAELADHPGAAAAALERLEQLRLEGHVSPGLCALVAGELGSGPPGDVTAPFKADRTHVAVGPHAVGSRAAAAGDRTPPVLVHPAGAATPDDPPQTGTVLAGRYRLEALLERGGMGLLYRATDLRRSGLDGEPAQVALKLANPHYAAPGARRALEREASLLAALNHPGVVRMLGFEHDGEHAFMVMELLTGEQLRSRIQRCATAALPTAEAMAIIRELAEVLAYLHGRGVVHRDVKPGNVFIVDGGGLRLVDFGLAAKVGTSGKPSAAAPMAGTPRYASPEMLTGVPPDPRDDVYSLACMAFELLAGRRPWGDLSADEAARRKLRLARPAGLSRARWKILRAALSFRAADRPPNAAAFLAGFFPQPRPRRVLPWVAVALFGGIVIGAALSVVGPAWLEIPDSVETPSIVEEAARGDGPAPAVVTVPAPEPV
ncbi:MAG: serine/threonine-protein kinase, partial [Gammaproteobacteria bacterium]